MNLIRLATVLLLLVAGCARKKDAAPETAALTDTAAIVPDNPHGLEWGDWVVTDHRMPGVSAMTVNEAVNWRGREAHYDPELAFFGADSCTKPTYRSQDVRGDSLLSVHYGVGPVAFGLPPGGTVTMIEVLCDGSPWNAPGATLLRMPDGTTYAVWDGAFFELRRPGAL